MSKSNTELAKLLKQQDMSSFDFLLFAIAFKQS